MTALVLAATWSLTTVPNRAALTLGVGLSAGAFIPAVRALAAVAVAALATNVAWLATSALPVRVVVLSTAHLAAFAAVGWLTARAISAVMRRDRPAF